MPLPIFSSAFSTTFGALGAENAPTEQARQANARVVSACGGNRRMLLFFVDGMDVESGVVGKSVVPMRCDVTVKKARARELHLYLLTQDSGSG